MTRRHLSESHKLDPFAEWFANRICEHLYPSSELSIRGTRKLKSEPQRFFITETTVGSIYKIVSSDEVERLAEDDNNWFMFCESHDWTKWKYDASFYCLPDGIVGEIVIYSEMGEAFFFTLKPNKGVKMTRAKHCCPTCHATSKTCPCP